MSEPLDDRVIERLADAARPDAPRSLGRYSIVRELGRGGMGVVYEADDAALGRRVALKLLPERSAWDATSRERFVREARAAARLDHPHIAAVFDATDEWIAMQLIRGVPLLEAVAGDARRAARLLRDAAWAVDYAHRQGVIHRDLKPQNLLVEGDRVFVTDFGLAKDLSAAESLSATGAVLGTPSYLAPEAAAGAEAGASADVYGLGATLYHALAGRAPFGGATVLAVLAAARDGHPAPLLQIAPSAPRDLAAIVHRCMEKDPARRYASAAAVAEDLTRWLEGRPVAARFPTWTYRASRFVQRHRAAAALSLVAAAAALAAGVALWNESAQRAASARALELSRSVDHILSDAGARGRLGELELGRKRIDAGVELCRAFLEKYQVADAHLLLGKLLRARGDGEAGLRALDDALRLDPALGEARLERGIARATDLLQQIARDGASASDWEKDLSPEARERRAAALADLAVLDTRANGFRAQDEALATALRARLLGKMSDARRAADEARRLDPANPAALVLLSQLDLAEGEGDAAWYRAMSALDLYRGFGPAYAAKSGAPAPSEAGIDQIARRHQFTAADERIESEGGSAANFLERANARLQLDDVEGALADFNAALAVASNDAVAHGARGLAHARMAARAAASGAADEALGEWERAADDFTAAWTLEPTLAGAVNNRGVARQERARLLAKAGRTAEADAARGEAAADFDLAVEQAPRFALAWINRGDLRRRAAVAALAAGRVGDARTALAGAAADYKEAAALRSGDAATARALASVRALEDALSGDAAESGGDRRVGDAHERHDR